MHNNSIPTRNNSKILRAEMSTATTNRLPSRNEKPQCFSSGKEIDCTMTMNTSDAVLHSEEQLQRVNNKRSDLALERQRYEFHIFLSRLMERKSVISYLHNTNVNIIMQMSLLISTYYPPGLHHPQEIRHHSTTEVYKTNRHEYLRIIIYNTIHP